MERLKVDFNKLARAFNPECIAVIGDKAETNYMWLRSQSAFKGRLYSVQIDPKEIEGIEALGVTNFTSLMDIPEPIDLAIVAVPRNIAVRVIDDLIKLDVAAAHFFTAGFSETDTEEGRELERILTEKAGKADFHLIGPNCMGIFSPGAGIGLEGAPYPGSPGQVGFISQSGTHAVAFAKAGYREGVDINKSVSFGNGIVLDSADYLDYFGSDPEIKVIGMYLEGVKDGKRFISVLKKVAAKKPVVIWKGGRTEEGERAIASHTGSLAVPRAIWDAAVKQSGAIKVNTMEGMVDTLKALLYLPPVTGDRVAVTGGSGGQSVAIADAFAEVGLKLPRLTRESYDELASFFTLIGGSYLNPIDTGNPNSRQMKRILEILERDTNTDSLVQLLNVRTGGPTGRLESHVESVIEIRKKTAKPVMAILAWSFAAEEVERAGKVIRTLQAGNVPAFISLERGAFALKKALDYYQLKNNAGPALESPPATGETVARR